MKLNEYNLFRSSIPSIHVLIRDCGNPSLLVIKILKLELKTLKYQGDPLSAVFTLLTFLAIKSGDRGKIF